MYIYNILRDKPLAAWTIDSAITSRGPHGEAGTMTTGSLVTSVGTARGQGYSGRFDNTHKAKFHATPYKQGYEAKDFTLEVTVIPTTTGTTGDQQILSNSGQFDGLSINGTVVSFKTQYSVAPDCVASYDVGVYKKMHIVGVHTRSSNRLYINGEQVANTPVSALQAADEYIATDGYLYIGNTTSDQALAVSTVAMYEFDLGDSKISDHYNLSRFNRSVHATLAENLFTDSMIGSIEANRYIDEYYNNETGWPATNNASILYQRLNRQNDATNTPIDSTVVFPIVLDDLPDNNIYGVVVNVDGVGFQLDASLDNETWTTFSNNSLVPIITDGSDPTGVTLLIRATLLASASDAYINALRVRGYRSGVSLSRGHSLIAAKTQTLTGLAPGVINDEMDFNDLTTLHGNGSIAYSIDASDFPEVTGTEVFILKRLSSAAISFPSGTTYINGVASAISNLPVGQWSVVHLVKSSATNTSFTVSGDFAFASIGTSTLRLTADQVLASYLAHFSADPLIVTCADVLAPTDVVDPIKVYNATWSNATDV